MNVTLQIAYDYVEKYGFSVIPILPGDKKPMVEWKEFQTRKPTRSEMMHWWASNPKANIGIVTGEVSNLFVVDFDKYAQDYDEEKALEIVPDNIITPTVETPRGGQHLYFNNPPDNNYSIKARILPGIDYRGNGGFVVAPPSINGTGKPYLWAKGMNLNTPRAELPGRFIELLNNASINNRGAWTSPETTNPQTSTVSTDVHIFDSGQRDENLFHIAHCLIKTSNSEEYIFQVLLTLMHSWGEHDEQWAKGKVESAIARAKRKDRNIAQDVRDFVLSTTGYFLATDLHKAAQMSTRGDQKAANEALRRLCAEGLIRKYGTKNGAYETIDKDCEVIDYLNVKLDAYDIRFPLEVHELVTLYPKSIVIIAGEANAGKTAYLLNLALKNKDRTKVTYFNSEMGAEELRLRLDKFNVPLESWSPVSFRKRSGNFDQVLDPNGLNIIDFLEIHKDFYEVGGLINDIHNKLDRGIAVIALQKPKGRDEGVGGRITLEKARLYVSIEPGKIKIIKAKIWAFEHMNPNGMFQEFKLGGGCHFKKVNDWRKA